MTTHLRGKALNTLLLLAILFSLPLKSNSQESIQITPQKSPWEWHFNLLSKVSMESAQFQSLQIKESAPALQFHRINPYHNPIMGMEFGVSYRLFPWLEAGLSTGLNGSFFEEYFYTRLEYRNVFLIPAYGSLRFQRQLGKQRVFLQADGGWLFNYQNFYRDYAGSNHLDNRTFREEGGFLLGLSVGVEKNLFQREFFLQLGYEINQNRVTIYLENLPLSWIGVASGTSQFTEYKNGLTLRAGIRF